MSYKNKLNLLANFCMVLTCLYFFSACKIQKSITKEDFLYFQSGLDSIKKVQLKEPVININDLLSIQISSASLNQEQTLPFNPAGNTGYLVNTSGNVEMPVIGAVQAAGLTQAQLQASVTEKVANYVKDPNVVIHFLQFKVNVLGQVTSPGVKKFDVDRVTILDAISSAGDLSDDAKREDITVIREENNNRRLYKVDIRSGALFQSPVYYMQSNDIVYVGASAQKFRDLKSGNTTTALRSLQIFGTILGLFSSIVFAVNVFNK